MNIFDAITKRRSVREFKTDKVKRDDIFILCEMGLHTPTAGDIQDIRFIISHDRKLIKALPGVCMDQTWISGAQALIAVCSMPDKQREYFGDHADSFALQGAAAATQNILLTAHALDIGACWISGFEQDKVDDLFGASGQARVESIIALGIPKHKPGPKKEKTDITSTVFFDQFGNNKPDIEEMNKDYAIKFEKALEEAESRLKEMEGEVKPWLHKLHDRVDKVVKKIQEKSKKKEDSKEGKK